MVVRVPCRAKNKGKCVFHLPCAISNTCCWRLLSPQLSQSGIHQEAHFYCIWSYSGSLLAIKQTSWNCLTNWCRSKILKPVEQGSTFEGITFTGEQKYKSAKTTNLLVSFAYLDISKDRVRVIVVNSLDLIPPSNFWRRTFGFSPPRLETQKEGNRSRLSVL